MPYTIDEAAEFTGYTPGTIRVLITRHRFVRGLDYGVKCRYVRADDGRLLRRLERFLTDDGLRRLVAHQFGAMWSRALARSSPAASRLVGHLEDLASGHVRIR